MATPPTRPPLAAVQPPTTPPGPPEEVFTLDEVTALLLDLPPDDATTLLLDLPPDEAARLVDRASPLRLPPADEPENVEEAELVALWDDAQAALAAAPTPPPAPAAPPRRPAVDLLRQMRA